MKIVISQPMYLPWHGIFEQVRYADIFIHYDDVQLPQGRSFVTRVQLKIQNTLKWLSVPIKKETRKLICAVEIDTKQNTFAQHEKTIYHALSKAPCFLDAYDLFQSAVQKYFSKICDFNAYFLQLVSQYFGFKTVFYRSSSLGLKTKSSQKILDICKHYQASTYITGHGAANYLDYKLFEESGVDVQYMRYNIVPYDQFGDVFTPYVSVLDLISHKGKDAIDHLNSTTTSWRDFLYERH